MVFTNFGPVFFNSFCHHLVLSQIQVHVWKCWNLIAWDKQGIIYRMVQLECQFQLTCCSAFVLVEEMGSPSQRCFAATYRSYHHMHHFPFSYLFPFPVPLTTCQKLLSYSPCHKATPDTHPSMHVLKCAPSPAGAAMA